MKSDMQLNNEILSIPALFYKDRWFVRRSFFLFFFLHPSVSMEINRTNWRDAKEKIEWEIKQGTTDEYEGIRIETNLINQIINLELKIE